MNETESPFASLRWKLYRGLSRVRCAVGIHRWKGYHDCGDGVHVQPISGYRKPLAAKDFRKCSWCGRSQGALRCGDDRMRFFVWGDTRA